MATKKNQSSADAPKSSLAVHDFTAKSPAHQTVKNDIKKNQRTRVLVKYDVGFQNSMSIRGKGANLNWNKGIPLKNVKPDEWVWETDASFNTCEFKVLINDTVFETGENHPISCGASLHYTPKF